MKRNRFTQRGTKRQMIGELASSGKTKDETLSILRPLVIEQVEPMIYRANNPVKGGPRIPKSIPEQLIELKHEIGRVWVAMGLSSSKDFDSPEIPAPESDEIPAPDGGIPDDENETETEDAEEIPEPEGDESEDKSDDDSEDEIPEEKKGPVAAGKDRIRQELAYFLRRVREIRAECVRLEGLDEFLDSISMRPVQAACRLIPAGIPAAALLHSLTIHWGQDSRNALGIETFDVESLSREIMEKRGITTVTRKLRDGSTKVERVHNLFGYIITLAENRIPIALGGPPGTGKSHLCGQVADFLGIPYGETPMSAGATRGDLLGRFTASPTRPFISAIFSELYGKGGVFNFEELDASESALLIVLNNALASDHFYNSNAGEMVWRHANFIAMATMNTWGLGATAQHSARERLDSATVDRWRMARVWVPLDEELEESILYSVVSK